MKRIVTLLTTLLVAIPLTVSAFTRGPLRYTKLPTDLFHVDEAEVYGPERPITGRIEIPYNVSTSMGNWKVVGIRSYAFQYCKLTEVTFSPAMRSIGAYAFNNCSELRKVEAMRGLKFIEGGAFSDCRKLEEFQFPESIKLIGEYAFKNCHKLKSAYFGEHVSSVRQGAFYDCWALESVVMDCYIQEVSDHCFNSCKSLQEVRLPRTVRRIGDSAFQYSGIRTIHMGPHVQQIGYGAFVGTPLEHVYIEAPTPPQILYFTENGKEKHITVHVPASAVAAYKQNSAWQKFNIVANV